MVTDEEFVLLPIFIYVSNAVDHVRSGNTARIAIIMLLIVVAMIVFGVSRVGKTRMLKEEKKTFLC